MNQNSNSYPPILAPSSELGALLFAALPCIHETYRPLASFAFHMTELSRLKNLSSMPPLSGFNNIDSLIADKETLLRSLSFYGNLFHMPLLSTIANLLQAMQFYNAYKDILPGLFSAMGGNGAPTDSMAGLFSGLGGVSPDMFSSLGGLSPDLLSSLFSGFSSSSGGNSFASSSTKTPAPAAPSSETAPKSTPETAFQTTSESTPEAASQTASESTPEAAFQTAFESTSEAAFQTAFEDASRTSLETSASGTSSYGFSDGTASADSTATDDGFSSTPDSSGESLASPKEASVQAGENNTSGTSYDLYDSLYSFLTPEQKEIYEQLMHTD